MSSLKVIKRDGVIVDFDKSKIKNAILKAMSSVDNIKETLAEEIANDIANIYVQGTLTVEDIQDLVEEELVVSGEYKIAKEYILYRNKRNQVRERKLSFVKQTLDILNGKRIVNSNANLDERSFSGRENESSAETRKYIAIDFYMNEDVAEACRDNYIYQHDLDKYAVGSHNCLFFDFKEVFTHGFTAKNGDVRPPSNFQTACQLVAVGFQCQSQVQFGGVASAHIDYDLAPYVLKSFKKHYKDGLKYLLHRNNEEEYVNSIIKSIDDGKQHENVYEYAMDMLEKEGQQACQGLYHNLNTLESRAGSQLPFTSINLGRDTSPEGRLVTKWMLEASIDGIGKFHKTSIFPISIFQIKNGINSNPDDPNYDLKKLALVSLSKRIYPNFINGNWSQGNEDPNDIDTNVASMGCRTLIGYDRHGEGYSKVGRGNNVPITLILPRLGIEYGICQNKRQEPDLEGFWNEFEYILQTTEKALLDRFFHMASQHPNSAPFMYKNNTMKGTRECKENVYNALKHNTLGIGYLGLAEMCMALFGANHANNQEVHEFALQVVKRISEFAKEASERNNLNFVCYATPAENLCYTAASNLRKQHGIIKNVTDREYLTNSHHVPVWEEVSIYKKLEIEAPFCKYPTAGCITYVELESTFMNNLKAIEDIIDYAFNQLDIPYLAFNFPIDTCLDCGYSGEFNDNCPQCGSEHIEQLRRVTGYLTTDYHNFNKGKIAEVFDRVKHSAIEKFE